MDGDLMRIWCLRRSDEKSKQTKEEILFCAKALRRSIVCGEDKIPAEVFKEEGPLQDALVLHSCWCSAYGRRRRCRRSW